MCYKYYDPNIYSSPPRNKKQYLYIVIKWALQNVKFSKPQSIFQALSASIVAEEHVLNYGPGVSRRQRKNKSRRQRPRLEWYQLKNINNVESKLLQHINDPSSSVQSHAKSVVQLLKDNNIKLQQVLDFAAMSAVDLNVDGSILNFRSAMSGPDAAEWEIAHAEEFDRLVEYGKGTFMRRSEVPKGKVVTYYNPQVKIKMKDGVLVRRVRGTIGGDRLPYDGPTSAMTAALETIRLLLNAIVSEKASYMCIDIKDYYLGTPLLDPEYMTISVKHIPASTQFKYGIQQLASNGSVVMRLGSTIYGLTSAGRLSQDRLIAHLAQHGYNQAAHTPCLFTHSSNGIAFALVVDDFLVKYHTQESADHLTATLRSLYIITVDTALKQKYVGITIDYNKVKGHMDLSMPGYVTNALTRFNKLDIKGANSPIVHTPPVYGAKSQTLPADSPPVAPLDK